MNTDYPVEMNKKHEESHEGPIADCQICKDELKRILERTDIVFVIVRSTAANSA